MVALYPNRQQHVCVVQYATTGNLGCFHEADLFSKSSYFYVFQVALSPFRQQACVSWN